MKKESVSESQLSNTLSSARTGDDPIPNGLLKGPSGNRHRSFPSPSNDIRPKSVKKASTFRPSVTGLGDAALLFVCNSCERGFDTSRSHMTFPLARSTQITKSLSGLWAVTKMRSFVNTGDECPGGRGVFQMTF